MTDQLNLTVRPSRDAIARSGGTVHLLVRAEPPARSERRERRPVALALVLDRSGSMAAPAAAALTPSGSKDATGDSGVPSKLGYVKAATERLLELMHDGDAISLVAFDDQVQVVKPLTVLTATSRRELAAAIKGLETGGSTNIEGAVREAVAQFSKAVRGQYGCKLVLLSDGEANVGETRPAVLAERAAGAAHNGVTVSTLGFGFDYNIALLSSMAEAGNGDFTHIESLETLDSVLREEFTTAAEVTAAGVEIAVDVPERLGAGTNLNSYRQEATDRGFKVFLGDLVRPKEFLVELTSPVELVGTEIAVSAAARYRDPAGGDVEVTAAAKLAVVQAGDIDEHPVDEEVLAKLLVQLPALAEMETVLGYESHDVARVNASLTSARLTMDRLQGAYGSAAPMAAVTEARMRLGELAAGAFDATQLKRRYDASSRLSRGRPYTPPRTM
jgi:Ca-activated chloride channel family protein